MPSRGEELLTELNKLDRRLKDIEAEKKRLNDEFPGIDQSQNATLKEAVLKGEKADISEFKKRKAEIENRLAELDAEAKAVQDVIGDKSDAFGEWDLKRLQKRIEKEKATLLERRKTRDQAEKVLREAQRALDIAQSAVSKSHTQIYAYEHGEKKLRRLIEAEPTDAERAGKQHRIQSERFFKEWDNAIYRSMESHGPSDARYLDLKSTIATYEKWHESNWSFRIDGQDEVKPPVRSADMADPFADMSLEAMVAVPYQKMLELAKEDDPEKRQNLITMYHAMGEQILRDAGRR